MCVQIIFEQRPDLIVLKTILCCNFFRLFLLIKPSQIILQRISLTLRMIFEYFASDFEEKTIFSFTMKTDVNTK